MNEDLMNLKTHKEAWLGIMRAYRDTLRTHSDDRRYVDREIVIFERSLDAAIEATHE